MLDHREAFSDRKLRLFAVACCRQVGRGFDPLAVAAVDAAENYADGLAPWESVASAVLEVNAEFEACSWCFAGMDCGLAAASPGARDAAEQTARSAKSVPHPNGFRNLIEGGGMTDEILELYHRACDERDVAQMAIQTDLLHDIFGNPFRPVTADPAWFTPTAVAIATAVYADRAFDRLPILADSLEEAGCTNADLLLHCRQPGSHVRGCWAVDLVLGYL